MKRSLPLLFSALLFIAGCSTANTVESRKQERSAAYASLPSATKALVDQGQIKVGMSMDAVYIAWGKPGEVLQNETEAGGSTVWVYYGGWMEETRYWTYRRLSRDYQPRTYVRAEIVFVNDVVKSWRTFPQPVY